MANMKMSLSVSHTATSISKDELQTTPAENRGFKIGFEHITVFTISRNLTESSRFLVENDWTMGWGGVG